MSDTMQNAKTIKPTHSTMGHTARSIMTDTKLVLLITITHLLGQCLAYNKHSNDCMLLNKRRPTAQECV